MADTVADALLDRLRDWDVRQVFGYPGDGINGLLAAWGRSDNDPQFVQARHEEMAAFEAVGYAKFAGREGVCAATRPEFWSDESLTVAEGLHEQLTDAFPGSSCPDRRPRR
jgi:glyoxylate carboligase